MKKRHIALISLALTFAYGLLTQPPAGVYNGLPMPMFYTSPTAPIVSNLFSSLVGSSAFSTSILILINFSIVLTIVFSILLFLSSRSIRLDIKKGTFVNFFNNRWKILGWSFLGMWILVGYAIWSALPGIGILELIAYTTLATYFIMLGFGLLYFLLFKAKFEKRVYVVEKEKKSWTEKRPIDNAREPYGYSKEQRDKFFGKKKRR